MATDWSVASLAEVAVFENRRRIPLSAAERAQRPGPYPYWGANGPFDSIDDYLFDSPRVLVAEDGNTVVRADGRATVHWAEGRYWVNNHAHVLSVVDGNDLRWLYYVLVGAQVRELVSGSAQPKLSMGSLKRLPLAVPPPREQRMIAYALSVLDDKIESNDRLVADLLRVSRTWFEHLSAPDSPRERLDSMAELVRDTVVPGASPEDAFEQFSIPAFDAGRTPTLDHGRDLKSGKTALPVGGVSVLLSKLNPNHAWRCWWAVPSGAGQPVCSPEFIAMTATTVPPEWLFAAAAWDGRFRRDVLSGLSGTTGSRQRVRPSDVAGARVPIFQPRVTEGWLSLARPAFAQMAFASSPAASPPSATPSSPGSSPGASACR